MPEGISCGGKWRDSGSVWIYSLEQRTVMAAAVVARPDPKWGELVMACVVLKPGHALTVEELDRHHVRTAMAKGLSSMRTIRSVRPARARSCVTMTMVMRCSR